VADNVAQYSEYSSMNIRRKQQMKTVLYLTVTK